MTKAPNASARGPGRIGVLGGTFNPIHLGHLRLAEVLSESFSLDRFLFVPSEIPPHKTVTGLCPSEVRLEMVRLAVADNPRFLVSDVEVRRGGTSYSVETLEALRREHGAGTEIFFAMADDAFIEIDTWKDWERLFTLAHLIVVRRPEGPGKPPETMLPVEVREAFCYSPDVDAFAHTSGKYVYFRDVGALPVSSTQIRGLVAGGRSIRYFVPESVATLIEQRGLYQYPDPGAR